MAFYGLCFVLVVLIVQKCVVYVEGEVIKSSLTFVIDYTQSMTEEINAVKEEVSIIFDKVSSSKASQIENFVIATFNDPDAEVRIITKDPNEFKEALKAIRLHSDFNYDCPEKSMTGIEIGLTNSLPLSYLYVFTDASAKDYEKLEQIKSLAQKKQSQVVFLLTGMCNNNTSDPKYQAYHQVAQASGGQIFHMMKADVKDILKYIEESITSRGVSIYNKKYPPGTHKVKFNVDAHTGAVLISVAGLGSKIGQVTGPGGRKSPTEAIVSGKNDMAVRRLNDAKPGDYEVEIEGKGEVHIIMIAKTDLNFQLGFSIDSPASMKDTVTRPPPGGNAFLGIRLLGEGVELTTAKIIDLDDHVIAELPLKLVDKKEQFYVTPSFDPPYSIFLVTVIGNDLNTGTSIVRTGPTPIARQNPLAEPAVITAPEVTIQGAPKIIVEYDAPLKLKCNVHGYPAPDIVWSEKDTGTLMPAKVHSADVPYDFVSTLEIKKANKNVSYQCKANNSVDTSIKYVEVEIEKKIYFDVIETPKDIRVEYTKEGSIICKIDADPPATIAWYKDGAEFSGNTNVDISSDKSILSIKNMQPELQGKYTCEAKNALDRKVFEANVAIFGVEEPVIDKSHELQRVTETTNAELSCRILKGIPKPAIRWSFKPAGMTHFIVMTGATETVHLDNVRKDQTGTYKCSAKNALGSDSFTKELVVEYPPSIKSDDKMKQINEGDEVRIPCDVTGEPAPTVSWFFQGTRLTNSAKILISSDYSIEFKATPSDIGDYTCEAKNKLDTAKKTVSLDVLEVPVIDKSPTEIRETEKTNAVLSCRILQGNPKPSIRWSFKSATLGTSKDMTETSETVHLKNVRKDQTGVYECTAENALGSDSFALKLVVEYPPIIQSDDNIKQIKDGDEVKIPCHVTGEPAPTVSWFFKGTRLARSAKIFISSDYSIKFKATPSDIGDYTCEAENKLDTVKKIVYLDVLELPVIDKSQTEIRVPEKTDAALSCKILQGSPKPSIRWSFQSATMATSSAMTETTETVHLNNVRKDQTGTFECSAKNSLGSDTFAMKLIVEYPPIIKSDVTVIQIKDDNDVKISCEVTGEPAPAVRWFLNDTRFDSTAMARVSSDHSFRFKARLPDIGLYRCEATNKLGSAKKTTELQVYIPVTIDRSKDSDIDTLVGESEILKCLADGYPEPHIKWTFQSSDLKIPAKDMTPTGGIGSLSLKNLQLDQQGSYTCEAENGIGGSDSFTYNVKVYDSPEIVKTYPIKKFEAMEGDVTLRIQCKATGTPKPSIVWMRNGLNLAMGSEWYDMEADGTLIIKNIDRDSEGSYVCQAENFLGDVTEGYEVTVIDHLIPGAPTSTIFVKEGETKKINCGIPHHMTDQMRWYKDSLPSIASGELTLHSVTRSDDGLYTCRVSNSYTSRSVTTKVVVEYKPEFAKKEKEIIEFVHGTASVLLSCEAYGKPKLTTATWKHNGNTLLSTEMSYPLEMVYGATGTYECEVSNAIGSIRRSFKVISRDCILDIKKDFPQKQPIMLSPSLTWPVFPVNDGYMIIPHGDYFYMHCPPLFSNPTIPEYPTVYCEHDDTIKINGHEYNFADITCKEEVKPEVSTSGNPCLHGKTENLEIGYKIKSKFLGVYQVCLDTKNNVPLFTKHRLSPYHTDRSTEAAWSNILLPQDFDTLYDCSGQMYDITSTLGRGLSTRDSCCFGKRQLVSSHNLQPGVPISSAYDYLNVIPYWSTCNSKNWEDVEKSVRELVKLAGSDLIISTGTTNPRRGGASTDITLHDGRGGKQSVASYIWKVVQDPAQSASLVIIQINIPELFAAEASKHVLCQDICGAGISWIEPSNWQNVEDGYTYCCSVNDFEKAFGYNGRFSPLMRDVLY